jgi:hypothetical protein
LYDTLSGPEVSIPYGISGTFDYSGGMASNVNVTLTGAGPLAGLYTTTDASPSFKEGSQNVLILPVTSVWDMDIDFASALSVSPDLLSYVYLVNQTFGYDPLISSTESGGVVFATDAPPPTSPTPEPSAIWLTTSGCALLGLLRQVKRTRS